MKKFRWILLSGLLVAATSVAQAQAPGEDGTPGAAGTTGTVDAGVITNAPGAATTTTTTTTGIAPDVEFVPVDGAAMESSPMPDTGGEPLIAVLAGLSIAGAAVAMRRKVTV